MMSKPALFRYCVLDLDSLMLEAKEIYGWKNLGFRKLIDLLLFKDQAVYLDALNQIHRSLNDLYWPEEVDQGSQEDLEAFWLERRIRLLERLEFLLDTSDIPGTFSHSHWLPYNQLILKRRELCYVPPKDHLVSERL